MVAKKKAPPEGEPETVEIVFDMSKIDLFTMLDLMETSTKSEISKTNKDVNVEAGEMLKFVSTLKATFVSSSRPLTGADFNGFCASFWQQFRGVQQPPN